MIENEFLFLGLLVERPKHGYEIKRQIEKELIPAIGIQIKSIYYPLKKMEEAGLIEKKSGREGRFPEKYIYSITDKGKKKFDDLIEKSFLSIERPFFQIDLALYFLPLIAPSQVKRRLKARVALLGKIQRQISAQSSNPIREHALDLVAAEILSSQKLIHRL